MSQKNDKDEASFEGLMSFSTAPPPAGDVHNARTVMAELPDDILASLKAGNRLTGLLGVEPTPPSEASMTRRARPFELEKAMAAAASRASEADVPSSGPLPAETAAALSFAIDAPAFPPISPISPISPGAELATPAPPAEDSGASDPVATSAPRPPDLLRPAPPDEPSPVIASTARELRPRRSFFRAVGVITLCAVAAVAATLSIPFLRQRLHLD